MTNAMIIECRAHGPVNKDPTSQQWICQENLCTSEINDEIVDQLKLRAVFGYDLIINKVIIDGPHFLSVEWS